ncbi:MAG: hypothetical protein GOU97_01915 [Nanoarchaeota archaeon]|nr:hypothetical protein [Nanoarchaeota archaeon]
MKKIKTRLNNSHTFFFAENRTIRILVINTKIKNVFTFGQETQINNIRKISRTRTEILYYRLASLKKSGQQNLNQIEVGSSN